MSLEKLMDELETMSKALPSGDTGEDDKKIQAAAAEEGDVDGDEEENDVDTGNEDEENGEADSDETADGEARDDDKGMAKSFSFTLEDGAVVEAEDGTELIKALMNRVEKNEGALAKVLEGTVKLIKSQGEMIKSLETRIGKLSGQGRGRKAILSIVEKQSPTMANKSEQPEGMSIQEFMSKAMIAQAEGRITGSDVARAESHLNKGMPVPADIVVKVAG
jgi:hypothetical protein